MTPSEKSGRVRHLRGRGDGVHGDPEPARLRTAWSAAPTRTAGGTRLYSNVDIARLHRIRDLLAEGLNLAGIAHVLRLEDEVRALRQRRGQPRRGDDRDTPRSR